MTTYKTTILQVSVHREEVLILCSAEVTPMSV